MPDLYTKDIHLGVKPSAPSFLLLCPPPYPGFPDEQTETQGTPQERVSSVLVENQTEIQTAPVSEVKTPVSI